MWILTRPVGFAIVIAALILISFGAGKAIAVSFTKSLSATQTINIVGAVSKAGGSFIIDHPLDPKNKLLYHSFVESPDVKNIYDGIAELDGDGEATITLPDYFLALNKDFRYLATPIGAPMPDLHLSSEVRKQFAGIAGKIVLKISGGVAGGRVSWQVSGSRHDPFIEANPIIPEVEKGPGALVEKGEYIFPEYYAR